MACLRGAGVQMLHEPGTSQGHHRFQRARLLEQVSRAGNHLQTALAVQAAIGSTVERQHLGIVTANDQQRRRGDFLQRISGEIRASATADDGPHIMAPRGRDKRRRRASARAEEPQRQVAPRRNSAEPGRSLVEPVGEQRDVENIGAVAASWSVRRSNRSVATPACCKASATKALRGLRRLLPLPWAKSTIPRAGPAGSPSNPSPSCGGSVTDSVRNSVGLIAGRPCSRRIEPSTSRRRIDRGQARQPTRP